MEYSFHIYNKLAADGAAMAADRLLRAHAQRKFNKTMGAGTSLNGVLANNKPPIVVCIGSDLAIGDSLGPITGSMLKFKTQGLNVFLYGTLASPVTAKEIGHLRAFLKDAHKGSQIIAVDAAVGSEGDIGLIKLSDSPMFPGAGANKKLGSIGDISVMGVVAEKSLANYGLLNTTRLNLVYSMAEIISDGLAALLWERCSKANGTTQKNA